jgi:predicted transcriptional regulator
MIQHSEKQIKALEFRMRQTLYSLISESPGLHFREIQRRTKKATGQLTYHLDYLQKADLIKVIRDGEHLRYYPHTQKGEEINLIECVRQRSIRHILLYLMENNGCNHEQLVKTLQLSPSTISWHLEKLISCKVVTKESQGRRSVYSINCPQLVKNVLERYQESFMDRLVDRFIETWEL